MNSVQLHLALTHVPVILSLIGVGMLIVALLAKNKTLVKTSYIIIVIAGIAALPVYFSGEGAEEAVEHLPGVSENVVERHEDVAKAGMITLMLAGLLALAAFFSFRHLMANRIFKVMVLAAGVIAGGFMFQTAKLGGEIRHTEISNPSGALTDQAEQNAGEQKNDDD